MSWINTLLHDGGPTAKALCLGLVAAIAVASFAGTASAGWGNDNDDRGHDDRGHDARGQYYRGQPYHDQQQGWNNGTYRAPPVVYQRYDGPAYYAPPLVYGSGLNLNISLP